MKLRLTLQNASCDREVPTKKEFAVWVQRVLQDRLLAAEICIRLVDTAESAQLNSTYRHKPGATNILSFPARLLAGLPSNIPHLGDLVICVEQVKQEAVKQHKPLQAHWAHLVIHGTLHLLGYDHVAEKDAVVMEALEVALLAELGYQNPYETKEQ